MDSNWTVTGEWYDCKTGTKGPLDTNIIPDNLFRFMIGRNCRYVYDERPAYANTPTVDLNRRTIHLFLELH